MAKYSAYIELSPHYESVVDINSEERNPNLWQEYIVHQDMRIAIEKICESLKNEKKDSRRSFWIHGAYGTGKTYAAIVLKHLFEDPIERIQGFLSRSLLLPYRERFLALRKRGDYLVAWRSGCTDVRSGTQLMMEMEITIRQSLKAMFGDDAYYGRKSLVSSVHRLLNDASINWDAVFKDPAYGLYEYYASLEELRREALDGNLRTCDEVARVCRDKGWGLFAAVDQFEEWIRDIISGNHLENTGIIFIWDEFTGFLRDCGDDHILQRLSELCKQDGAPFFMCLIVHRDPGWVGALGDETYARILHRYHELEFHISESAAYDLIGNSILTRVGMETQWNHTKDQLMESIRPHLADFDDLDMGNKQQSLRQLCPLHPMTLSLLATVAQNFGASQRTLFRFMKDVSEADQGVGFTHYIANYGPDDWRWLTPDFLWDYFFTRESDIREFTTEARRAFQHFSRAKESVASDETAMHVFKAAMLLIAVMSTERISQLRSQSSARRISASKRTLYRCFAGQLTECDIDRYLDAFESNGILRLDKQANGDARLELPYAGSADVFELRLQQVKRKYTRHELFKKTGTFSRTLEDKVWEKTRATFSRMHIIACSAETNSLNSRLVEMRDELQRHPYKIGLLLVTITEPSHYTQMIEKLRVISREDSTERMVVCLAREPLTNDQLDEWHRAIANQELAAEEGKRASATRYESEAAMVVEKWAATSTSGQLTAFYKDTQYTLYGRDDLMHKIEADVVFRVFGSAPEIIVSQITAFKRAQEAAAIAGVTLTTSNAQLRNIASQLETTAVWEVGSIAELETCDSSDRERAVSSLARFIRSRLSQGSKVLLDQLWLELQSPPYGYYDCMACAYLLGFVLRFYVNTGFHWTNSDGNPFPLTEENLAAMISLMCKNKAINHTLSSGSQIWQGFREYARSIFRLTDSECSSEEQARKYMRERITSSGTPFWCLKYAEEDTLGGSEARRIVSQIVDRICEFVYGQGDQEKVMSDVLTLFKGRGYLRQVLVDAFQSGPTRYAAFRQFILQNQTEIGQYLDSVGLDSQELLDAVREMMQGAIYTWTEEQVVAKLEELLCEYRLVDILNKALGIRRDSIRALQKDLSNCFEHMKVPGTVIESLSKPWIPALQIMRKVSLDEWLSLPIEAKKQDLDTLADYARPAWELVTSPKSLLADYMTRKGLLYTDEHEVSEIYAGLGHWPYNMTEAPFLAAIQSQIKRLDYEQKKSHLVNLWMSQSGSLSVSKWCRESEVPVQWVVNSEALDHIETLKATQDGKRVDETALHNAVLFFERNDLSSILRDSEYVRNCFVSQVGQIYRAGFCDRWDEIISRIRLKFGADVYMWANRVGEIRDVAEAYIRDEMAKEHLALAQEAVRNMPERKLRDRVATLLSRRPELCRLFLE